MLRLCQHLPPKLITPLIKRPVTLRFFTMATRPILCLFDVDGTLTASRLGITDEMKSFMIDEVRPKADIALVGGSDYVKIREQMGGEQTLEHFFKVFSENGLVAHKNGVQIYKQTIQDHVGEEALQQFINFSLRYMSELILPVKRGTFIEFRTGLINVCPVGRSCTQQEREQFEIYDKEHDVRKKFISALKKEFPQLGLEYCIGGQISFDVFPVGWDKTYCLRHIPLDQYKEVHFFGDKTDKGGNDHEICNDPRVVGHTVTSPKDTRSKLQQLLHL